jgi:hypothetical protein
MQNSEGEMSVLGEHSNYEQGTHGTPLVKPAPLQDIMALLWHV